jgi:hypothetical protein
MSGGNSADIGNEKHVMVDCERIGTRIIAILRLMPPLTCRLALHVRHAATIRTAPRTKYHAATRVLSHDEGPQ